MCHTQVYLHGFWGFLVVWNTVLEITTILFYRQKYNRNVHLILFLMLIIAKKKL